MKDRKLLIRVRCTTRKFYLHRPRPGRNDWHVRFTAPAIDGARRIFRSTGAKEIGPAKRIAAQIIESFWAGSGRGADRLKLRSDHAKIGDLIKRYCERATQRPSTIRSNVRSLRMIVKTVHSGDPDTKPGIDSNSESNSRIREATGLVALKSAAPTFAFDGNPAGSRIDCQLRPAGTVHRRAPENEILRRPQAAGSSWFSRR